MKYKIGDRVKITSIDDEYYSYVGEIVDYFKPGLLFAYFISFGSKYLNIRYYESDFILYKPSCPEYLNNSQ